MPGIWNINNGYNSNTRKISSKLTFEAGEKFTGRIVDKGEGKDVIIKLADGWQFIAEVDGKVNLEDIKLVKFQVEGFENGKLKLKIVQGDISKEDVQDGDENYQEIAEKEGLSKEDIELLKKMVKHNFSLSKENIDKIKTILQFSKKINSDSQELNRFIEKYILSKGVEVDSEQGIAMKETLTKFINEFKNMSTDDILTFLENSIDFTKENIESFNKLFKSDSSIEKILTSIKDKISNECDIKTDFKEVNININQQKNSEEIVQQNTLNKSAFSKVYAENSPNNNKINVLEILKTLAGNGGSEEKIHSDAYDVILDKSILDKLTDKNVANEIREVVGDKSTNENLQKTQASNLLESTNKVKVEDILSKSVGKDISLSDTEYKKIVELVQNKEYNFKSDSSIEVSKKSDVSMQIHNNTENSIVVEEKSFVNSEKSENIKTAVNNDIIRDFSDVRNDVRDIKSEIKSKINNVRDIVKELISNTITNDSVSNKITNIIKDNINDIKVFNTVSNEYYCLNFDIQSQLREYPCRLIIKDNRKDGKKIDRANTKMVLTINTANLGEIDGYLIMRENNIDVNLKCDNKYTIVLDNHRKELVDGLATLGLFVTVKVTAKENNADIVNVREFFNDVTISSIDTKV
ncbi:MAG: flagellar hook-length control protein FliK, partial [Clostridium sp.]